MEDFPVLHTSRLMLDDFCESDKPALLRLISNKEVARTTLRIPHPCSLHDVEAWLVERASDYRAGQAIRWAMRLRDGELIGGISLTLNKAFESAELGYWVGKPFWGNGYATEASRKVITYGFESLQLNRIEAHSMFINEGSKKILERIGMRYEGLHPQMVKRWGTFMDVISFGMLRSDYLLMTGDYKF